MLCFHSDINVEYSSVVFSPHPGRGSSWDCLCILVISLSDLRLWWQVKPMRLAVYFLLAFTNVTCWCDNWKDFLEQNLVVTHHIATCFTYISAIIRTVKTLCDVDRCWGHSAGHDWQPAASIFQDSTDLLMLHVHVLHFNIQHLCCYKLKQLGAEGVKMMHKLLIFFFCIYSKIYLLMMCMF